MSDGNFKWFYGEGSEPEAYHGQSDTRDEAIAKARADENCKEFGFTIVEADRSVASTDIFDADSVFDQYQDHNEECWGEDGADIEATGQQMADLEAMLSAALAAWFEKHSTKPVPWCFGTMRNEEFFPPQATPRLMEDRDTLEQGER